MRRSRLSQYKQNKLIELFVAGVTAGTAAQLVGVNKNTAAYHFHRLRLLIFHSSPHLEMFDGEADESYFGGHRKGRRGRGAAGKVAVFGLLKRNGKVYTVAVPNLRQLPYCLLSVSRSSLTVSSIRIVIKAMMCRMSVSLAICASTIVHTLPKGKTTSTALRTFGIRQNGICANLTAFPKSILGCI